MPFPVTIKGRDASNREFKLDAWLDNLSAGGIYLRLAQALLPGTRLFLIIRLSTQAGERQCPRVAARGVVLRSELQPDGTYGLAVVFTRYRFL